MNLPKPKPGYKWKKTIYQQHEEIPKDWDFVNISEIGEIIGGGTPDTTESEYWKDGNISWYTPEELTKLESNFVKDSKRKITQKGLDKSSAKILQKGTILITTRATIGNCAISENKVTTNQGFQNLEVNKNHNNRFLMYSIRYNKRRLMQYAQGTTFLEISKTNLGKIKIPCPNNVREEEKIGLILSNIDELIQKQQEVITQTQKLMKGQMQKLLTSGLNRNDNLEPIYPYGEQFQTFSIPKTWKVKKLENLCQMITDGSHFSPGKDGEYPLATVENMSDGKIDVDSCYKIHKSDYEYLVKNNCQPKNNDVLFSKDGTVGLCLVYTQPDKIVVLSSIAIIRTKPDELDPNFLKYILKSRYMQVYLAKFKSGTAIKRIILKNISEFTFPLPSTIEEQQKIASILSNLDSLIQEEKQYKEKLEKIKRWLMQQLLTGKTRVKV